MTDENILATKHNKRRCAQSVIRVHSGGRTLKISNLSGELRESRFQDINTDRESKSNKITLEASKEPLEEISAEKHGSEKRSTNNKKGKHISSVPSLLVKNSSVPAVSKIELAKSQFRKFLWVFILFGLFFLCLFHVQKFVSQYLKYPVMVTLKIEQENSLEFPSVTVCNLNRIQSAYKKCLTYHLKDITECRISSQNLQGGNLPNYNNLNKAPKGVSLILSEISFLTKGRNVTGEKRFLYDYYKTSENVRFMMSHRGEDFIKSCEYQGRRCTFQNFDEFYSRRYGRCLTFVPPEKNDDGSEPSQVRRTGKENGLRLVLDYEPVKYHHATQVVGGRIAISHPSEIPDPEEKGFTLSPGMETSISLKQTIVKRLPPPYKDFCWDYAAYTEADDRSPRECRRLCIQSFNFAKCGCSDPTMSMSGEWEPCNLLNMEQMVCLNEALESLARDSSSCYCPRACESTYYNELLSHSKYPSLVHYVLREACNKSHFEKDRHKFGVVNVYYSSMERKIFEQAPFFQSSELLSNLGGEFGIWLGMSMFALFELTEKLLTIIYFFWFKKGI